MLNPCKPAVVFDFWGFHCPNADAATRQVRKILVFTLARVLEKKCKACAPFFLLPQIDSQSTARYVDRRNGAAKVNYQQADLGVMDQDAITVLLIARTLEHIGIGSFELYVSNADALYEELLAKGAKILGPPVSRPWGLRDFRVIDLEGNRITFAQTFE